MTELASIHVVLPNGRILTMQELVEGWQRHITRLAEEMRGPIGKETWGAHDYFAALNLRDLIESGRSGVGHDQDRLIDASVAGMDEVLRAITEDDRRGVVIRYGEPKSGQFSRWWWHRVPTSGLVREELESWVATDD